MTTAGVIISGQTYGEVLAVNQIAYLKSDGKWWKARANAEATSTGEIGLTLDAGSTGRILKLGYQVNAAWAWTPGSPVYLSAATAGALTQTRPIGEGSVVRVIGYPSSATVLWVGPGDPQTIVTVEGLATEVGALIQGGVAAWEKLSPGAPGKVLTSNGAGNAVSWKYPNTSDVVGIEWDTMSTSSTVTRIDAAGNPLGSLQSGFFDAHPIWGGRWRCVRDRTTGAITYGTNARGDGLTLDGTAGDVLVRKPLYYARHEFDADTNLARYWVSPTARPGFEAHPYWYMRGEGALASEMFGGAYESYGYLDDVTYKLGSATGKTPVTGEVAYPDLPNAGRLHINDAEAYAGNVAPGFGCESFWGYCADQLLMYIEYGSLDIQTALGKGIVDLASGTGFAGKNTGADGIDALLAENGTGVGSGLNGQTPVCWRGIENPYGNTWKFIIGANTYLDGSYRLIRRDGTGTLAGTLAEGSYESGTGLPLANGYISGLLHGEPAGLAFLPSAAAGSDSSYLADYWYACTANGNILLAGGGWRWARGAGPGFRGAYGGPTYSSRSVGARLEFRPPQGV